MEFKEHSYPLFTTPPTQVTARIPFKPKKIMFVGDLQWMGRASGNTAVAVLERELTRAVEEDMLLIGMGDVLDWLSPNNRQKLMAAGLYDTARGGIDQLANYLLDEVYEVLSPTKGRWLGLVEGHHFHEYRAGYTSDMKLAEKLETTFLGSCGIVRLVLSTSNHDMPYVIWVHHGVGNGQTGYYPLTRLEKVSAAWEEIDCFAMGHTTKSAVEAANKTRPRWWPAPRQPDITYRKVILIGTGGYSRTYREGTTQGAIPRGGYAEQKMMAPAVLGSPTVNLYPSWDGNRLGLDARGEA